MRKTINFYYAKENRVNNMCAILKKISQKTPIELLSEYKISLKPPIDIAKLLDEIGISTIAKDFSDAEESCGVEPGSILGAAFSNNDKLVIFYKKTDSLHRKRFTIAHELAHCCYDCPQYISNHIEFRLQPYINLSKDEYEKEKRANIFAGELLIPQESLMKVYDKMLIPSLTTLSDIFNVSTSVMSARLDHLKLSYYKDNFTESVL